MPKHHARRDPILAPRVRRAFSVAFVAATVWSFGVNAGCGSCDGSGLTELEAIAVPDSRRLEFGGVFLGASSTRIVGVENVGTAAFEVTSLETTGSSFVSVDAAVPVTVPPGQRFEASVVFTPTSAQIVSAQLQLIHNAGNTSDIVVELVGSGLEPLDCPPSGPCTEVVFDPSQGVCVSTNTADESPCEDESVCTVNSLCLQGNCLSEDISASCDDEDPCTIDFCNATQGCLSVPDPTVCDDENPCTDNFCNADGGCSFLPKPDGTFCGQLTQCEALGVCQSGACVDVVIADGTPCDDGNPCTQDDACQDQECVGATALSPPELGPPLVSIGSFQVAFSEDLSKLYSLNETGLSVFDATALPDVVYEGTWFRDQTGYLFTLHVAQSGHVILPSYGSLKSIDVSNPSEPILVDTFELPEDSSTVTADGVAGFAFYTSESEGLVGIETNASGEFVTIPMAMRPPGEAFGSVLTDPYAGQIAAPFNPLSGPRHWEVWSVSDDGSLSSAGTFEDHQGPGVFCSRRMLRAGTLYCYDGEAGRLRGWNADGLLFDRTLTMRIVHWAEEDVAGTSESGELFTLPLPPVPEGEETASGLFTGSFFIDGEWMSTLSGQLVTVIDGEPRFLDLNWPVGYGFSLQSAGQSPTPLLRAGRDLYLPAIGINGELQLTLNHRIDHPWVGANSAPILVELSAGWTHLGLSSMSSTQALIIAPIEGPSSAIFPTETLTQLSLVGSQFIVGSTGEGVNLFVLNAAVQNGVLATFAELGGEAGEPPLQRAIASDDGNLLFGFRNLSPREGLPTFDVYSLANPSSPERILTAAIQIPPDTPPGDLGVHVYDRTVLWTVRNVDDVWMSLWTAQGEVVQEIYSGVFDAQMAGLPGPPVNDLPTPVYAESDRVWWSISNSTDVLQGTLLSARFSMLNAPVIDPSEILPVTSRPIRAARLGNDLIVNFDGHMRSLSPPCQ